MAIRVLLCYVKKFFNINDTNSSIDSQFEYLLGKVLDEGVSSSKLMDLSIDLYGELLNGYSENNTKHR